MLITKPKYARPRRRVQRPPRRRPRPTPFHVPPAPVATTLQTASGFYVTAEGGGGREVVANRSQAGVWENWIVHTHDDGTVSLQAHDGHYLSAEVDGTVVANRPLPDQGPIDAFVPGPWEIWTIETRDLGVAVGVAFRSHHGKYLCAEGGGGGIVVANRPLPDQDPATVPGEWEFFGSAVEFWKTKTNANTLAGYLRRNGRVISDETGPRLLMFAHFMEAFSAFVWGKYDVEAQLKIIAEHYAGIRFLDVLGYWDCERPGDTDEWDAWIGREVTPIPFVAYSGRQIPATPNYWEQKKAFLTLVHDCGLKVFDDRGDMNAWANTDKIAHMDQNGQLYASLPFGRDILAGVFGINEAWQNGGDDNVLLADMITAFETGAGWLPAICGLSAPGGDSDPDALAAADPPMTSWEPEMPASFLHWSIDDATVLTVHGNRGSHEHIVEHYFNYGYDAEMRASGKVPTNTEPVGGGEGVSVGRVDDPELLCALTAAALIGGQPWVWMSGNGVFWDGPIEDMPGFVEVPRLPSLLPQDIATFPTVVHAGTTWAGKRILAAVDPTRAEHAIADDGRFAIVVHTELQAGNALPVERACSEFTVINLQTGLIERTGPIAVGDKYQHAGMARLVVGRLA